MSGLVEHSCRCGATRLKIAVPAPTAGTRVVCYCKDCQTAALLHDGASDVLSRAGGSDIWQTTPDLIDITDGAENLKVIRLSPKGLMRWHAGCCGTPMLNTLSRVRLPFVGVVLRQSELAEADAVFGAIECHASTGSARPEAGAPEQDIGFNRAGAMVLKRLALAVLGGRSKNNPLLQPDGTLIAPVVVISREERAAALPEHLR